MYCMKVYYVANIRLPNEKAHGIQLAKMCEAFLESGTNLELLVPWQRGLTAKKLKEFYGLRQSVTLRRLPVINIFPVTRFGFNLRALTFAAAYFFYFLAKKITGERAVIYTIDLDQFSFFPMAFLGWPYFFETHATKRKSRLYDFFLRRARGIIAINSWIKNDLRTKFGLTEGRFLVFPNGIDFTMFNSDLSQKEARAKLKLPLNQKIIAYIGRFYDWKGLEIVAPAAEFLPADFVFYLVGGTTVQFQDIAAVKTIPENIVCVGARPYQEMPLWVAAADLLLVIGTKSNDYSYYQTSPMKIFEYMASRRPIVASRTPAVHEILSESEAVFYEPDNAESLGIAIRSVLADEKLLFGKIDRAYDKVRSYSWLNRAQAIQNFISYRHS